MYKCSILIVLVFIFNFGVCGNHPGHHSLTRPKERTNVQTIENSKPTNGITVPIMIHLDKKLTSKVPGKMKIRRQKLKVAAKKILKEVEEMFKDPSLNLTISFELLNVRILKDKIAKIIVDGNAVEYLRTYCKWQGDQKLRKKNWWYSILFTGLDLYYFDNRRQLTKRVTSRSYMKGMCSINNSCTLTEWGKKNTAFMLTHEIAHSLGVHHDGHPNNECRGHHIMSPVFSPLSHVQAKTWSSCSRRDLQNYLSSNRAWCLNPEESNKYILV